MSDVPVPSQPREPASSQRDSGGDAADDASDRNGTAGTSTPASILNTADTLIERMGIELLDVSADRVTGRMPVAGNTQPYGLLHGGASAVLAETLGSVGAVTHAGPGRIAVGIELNCSHHRSARSGFVHAEANAIHLGRSLATYEIVVTDDEGRRVCTARLSCVVRAAPGS